VAEFQGFVRDLHDLGADKLVEMSQPDVRFQSSLVAAATEGCQIDSFSARCEMFCRSCGGSHTDLGEANRIDG
jgi:hypothetical protein